MQRDAILLEYEGRRHILERLRSEVVFALEEALRSTRIKTHSITSRVKSAESLLRKADRKGMSNPLAQIHDIVGARIVCLFLSDVPSVAEVVRTTFEVTSEDNKLEHADLTTFGYFSVHFNATLKPAYVGPRYDVLRGQNFEIQVRTIAMDAWANVSHHLSYRSDIDIPDELKRDFYALSGLFYVADKHFEMFYRTRVEASLAAVEKFATASAVDIATQPLNLDTLAAYLVTKFPNRHRVEDAAVSGLLNDVIKLGFKTVGEIDSVVTAALPALVAYERAGAGENAYGDANALRLSLFLYDRTFVEHLLPRGEAERRERHLSSFRSLVHRGRIAG